MEIKIQAANFELTESLKTYIQAKIGSLDQYLADNKVLETHVEMEVDKSQQTGEIYRAEVMIYVPKDMLRAEEQAHDMHVAIDHCREKLQVQIEKYKAKTRDKKIREQRKNKTFLRGFASVFMRESKEQENPKIVKRKRFSNIKPTTEDEAIEQMKLIGHDCFLFYNAQSERYAVIYKRDDGNYGLIEPKLED